MRVFLTSLVLLLVAGPALAQDLSPREIAAKARPAVVLVTALDGTGEVGQGSGFVVSADGRIVTNRHVVEGARSLRVQTSTGETYDQVYFVSEDERRDLVILRIPAVGLARLEIADDRAAAVGDPVYVMGNPLGLEGTFSNGLISARRNFDGTDYIQISAPISSGSSGGPVLDAAGQVIGVATLMFTEGQNLNIAVPARYAAGLLAMNETPTPWTSVASRFAVAESPPTQSLSSGSTEELARWERVLLNEMDEVDRVARENGLVETHKNAIEMMNEDETYSINVNFSRIGSAILVAVCDADCTDIDLAVYDGNNRLVERDLSVGDRAFVAFDVAQAGRFRAVASMAACSVEPCGFAIMAYGAR